MKDWNELSMKERAAFIKVGVSNGLKSIDDIQKSYREYAEGGAINLAESENNLNNSRSIFGRIPMNKKERKELLVRASDGIGGNILETITTTLMHPKSVRDAVFGGSYSSKYNSIKEAADNRMAINGAYTGVIRANADKGTIPGSKRIAEETRVNPEYDFVDAVFSNKAPYKELGVEEIGGDIYNNIYTNYRKKYNNQELKTYRVRPEELDAAKVSELDSLLKAGKYNIVKGIHRDTKGNKFLFKDSNLGYDAAGYSIIEVTDKNGNTYTKNIDALDYDPKGWTTGYFKLLKPFLKSVNKQITPIIVTAPWERSKAQGGLLTNILAKPFSYQQVPQVRYADGGPFWDPNNILFTPKEPDKSIPNEEIVKEYIDKVLWTMENPSNKGYDSDSKLYYAYEDVDSKGVKHINIGPGLEKNGHPHIDYNKGYTREEVDKLVEGTVTNRVTTMDSSIRAMQKGKYNTTRDTLSLGPLLALTDIAYNAKTENKVNLPEKWPELIKALSVGNLEKAKKETYSGSKRRQAMRNDLLTYSPITTETVVNR